MLKIKDLTIKNFLSVGNKTEAVNFDRQDLTLILGENLDLGGNGARNGVGKTVIMNALNYVLYGQAMSNIRVNNLINKTNDANMLVSVEFEIDNKDYRIERGRKPNVLRFFENNVETLHDDMARGESRETQKDIEQVLGMTHDMFKHTISLNTSTIPFLKMKANDQKNIIEQLLGITVLTEKAEVLKENFKASKNKIEHEELHIQAIVDANTHIETQIKKLITRQTVWTTGNNNKINNIEVDIADLSKVNIDAELEQHKLLQQYNNNKDAIADANKWVDKYNDEIIATNRLITKANNDINKAKSDITKDETSIAKANTDIELLSDADVSIERDESINKIHEKIKKNNDNKAQIQKFIDTTKKNIAILRQKIIDTDDETHECPTCGQDCEGEHSVNIVDSIITQLNAEITKDNGHIKRELKTIKDIDDEILDFDEDIADIYRFAEEREIINAETIEERKSLIIELNNSINELDKDIFATDDDIIKYNTALIDIDTNLSESKLILADIGELGMKPKTHYKDIDEAHGHKNTLDTLIASLTEALSITDPYNEQIKEMKKDGIVEVSYTELNRLVEMKEHQAFLLKLLTSKDSFIRRKIIEQNLNYLNNRLTHYLTEIGLPHSVKFMSDLTVEITDMGRELDEGNLSRGENTRLILALSFAFRDVHESTNNSSNLVFIDELLDSGLDSVGVEASVKILKRMARERHKSVWLISHREELTSRVHNIFTVRKSEGFTSFKND